MDPIVRSGSPGGSMASQVPASASCRRSSPIPTPAWMLVTRSAALMELTNTLTAANAVYGLRGRFASIGHWVFHAGLLAILLVAGSLAAAPPPFGGSAGIGEGEAFDLHTARFVSSNQDVDPDLPSLRFRVDSVRLRIESQAVKGSEVGVTSPEGTQATIGIFIVCRAR